MPAHFLSDKMIKVLLSGTVVVAFATVFAVAMTIAPRQSVANPYFHRVTGKDCSYCHVRNREPALNSRGERFKNCIDSKTVEECARRF